MNENSQDRAENPSEAIRFSSSAELCKISVEMIGLAKRHVDIVSRSLEPTVYDTLECFEALKQLAIARRGRIRIIILDPDSVISRGSSRLVQLAMRLSSFIEIRRPGEDHLAFNEAMLIVDRKGIVHRKYADRYEGIANAYAPRQAAQLTECFESMWQNAETIPYFRRLML